MNSQTSSTTDGAGRNGILASMCLALVLVVASVSSVNLALTGISLDLGTTSSQLTWIADGYTVALAALVLPFGALGDRLGRRTLLLAGTDRVRPRRALRGGGTVARSAHRLPGRHGHRRGDDHARNPVDDHGGVPRLEAQPGRERLGRLRQLGRDPRHAGLRADPRVVQLAGDASSRPRSSPRWPSSPPWCSPRTRPTPTRP